MIKLLKPATFILCLLPFLALVWGALTGQLGADPQKYLVHTTGDWGLRLLLVTLAVTPVRRLTGWNRLQSLRRMLGLYCFFYISLHFSVYGVLYVGLDWGNIVEDIAERPYITVGFAAFLGLIALAATSTNAMMKRLGRRWARLHRLIYLIAVLACVHFLWLVKSDLNEPLIYTVIVAVLLGVRVYWRYRLSSLAPSGTVPARDLVT